MIPEVEKIKEKHIEERDKAIMSAEERYNKLNVLKRAKLFLSHQNPKNISFHELDIKHINDLYEKNQEEINKKSFKFKKSFFRRKKIYIFNKKIYNQNNINYLKLLLNK